MKKTLSLVLAIVFCFSLAACKSDTANEGPSNGETPDTPLDTPPEIVHKVYDLSAESDTANIKIHGRSAATATGINCDSSASGIEFNAYIEGELKITLEISQSPAINETRKKESYFALYVNGVRSEEKFRAAEGESTLTLASFENGEVRNIKLIKLTEAHCALCTVKSLEFTGYFEEKPADKDLYIEFIGDSITAGYGNLHKIGDSNVGQASGQDASQSYAYLTAEMLDADASLICVSGMGISKGYRQFTAGDFFGAQSYYRDANAPLTAERKPDMVVINLGTNDANKQADSMDLMNKVSALVTLVRAKYGKSVPIVWAHGMMGDGRWSEISIVLNGLGGEANGIYSIEIARNNDGGGGHPSIEGHKYAARLLSDFIKSKELDK